MIHVMSSHHYFPSPYASSIWTGFRTRIYPSFKIKTPPRNIRGGVYLIQLSWNVVLDDQLWTGGCTRVPAVQAEVIGDSIIVVIQFESQSDLR